MHIIRIRDFPPTVFQCETSRRGDSVRKPTPVNLSSRLAGQIVAIRAVLRDEQWQRVTQSFELTDSRAQAFAFRRKAATISKRMT